LSATAVTAPTTGPYSTSSRSARAANLAEGAAAAAAMVADELHAGSVTAAAAADAGEAGEVLAPLRLLYRGLRLRAAVSCGPLKGGLVAGDVSGHVSYRGKAFAQLGKLMAKAKTGQVRQWGSVGWDAGGGVWRGVGHVGGCARGGALP
jgi:hypothetical protein